MTRTNTITMNKVFNRHISDFPQCDFTMEFNVKNLNWDNLDPDLVTTENETGWFANNYAQELTYEIQKRIKSRTWSVDDWSFAGRSNGWFVLICYGDMERVTPKQQGDIETLVAKYKKNFNKELKKYYHAMNGVE